MKHSECYSQVGDQRLMWFVPGLNTANSVIKCESVERVVRAVLCVL